MKSNIQVRRYNNQNTAVSQIKVQRQENPLTSVRLKIFQPGGKKPWAEVPMPAALYKMIEENCRLHNQSLDQWLDDAVREKLKDLDAMSVPGLARQTRFALANIEEKGAAAVALCTSQAERIGIAIGKRRAFASCGLFNGVLKEWVSNQYSTLVGGKKSVELFGAMENAVIALGTVLKSQGELLVNRSNDSGRGAAIDSAVASEQLMAAWRKSALLSDRINKVNAALTEQGKLQ